MRNILQGYIPCMYHIGIKRKDDEEVLSLLIPLAKTLELTHDDVSLITIAMKESGHLSRRYSAEELINFKLDNRNFSCSDMINHIGSDVLCKICEYSPLYQNYNFHDEKRLLSYCMQHVKNREKVELIVGNRINELFRSLIRIGKDDISLTYVNLNKIIFEYLLDRFESFDDLTSEESISDFFHRLVPPENNPTCYISNATFIRTYYCNLFKNREKCLIDDTNLEDLINKLLVEYKGYRNDKGESIDDNITNSFSIDQVDKDIIDNPGSLILNNELSEANCKEDVIELLLESELAEEPKNDFACTSVTEEVEVSTAGSIINLHEKVPVTKSSISERVYPETYQMEIKRYKTIRQIISESDAIMLDYDILKNKYMCIELVKYNTNDGLLIYLPNGNVCYYVTLDNPLCNDIVGYYLKDDRVIKKLCMHAVPIIAYVISHGYDIRNYFSLQTLYNFSTLDSLSVTCDKDLIERSSNTKYNNKYPFLVYAVKKYVEIYETYHKVIAPEQLSLLHKELLYEKIVAASFNLKDLSRNARKVPHYVSFSNQHDYKFAYIYDSACDKVGVKLSASFLQSECSDGSLIAAYKDVCSTCVESGVFDKYNIRLLQLDAEQGLVFHINESALRIFFSLLNRWMISSGKRYIINEPLISIKAKPVVV